VFERWRGRRREGGREGEDADGMSCEVFIVALGARDRGRRRRRRRRKGRRNAGLSATAGPEHRSTK